MTIAAVAPVSSNQTAIWVVIGIVAAFAICAVLYQHERKSDRQGNTIAAHDEQLATLAYQMPALLEWLGIEIPAPVVDDSPSALEAEPKPEEMPTDEFPVAPETVPDGMPLAVQTALIDQRPSPVPRDLSDEFPHPVDSDERKAKNAADIDERLKRFDFSGRNR